MRLIVAVLAALMAACAALPGEKAELAMSSNEVISEDAFWTLVEPAAAAREPDAKITALRRSLSGLTADQLVTFQERFTAVHEASSSWDLWGAAYLMNGGCSDDCFVYFRTWLILQGRDVYERAVAEPDALATLPVTLGYYGEPELEEGMYVAAEVWSEKTGLDAFAPDSPFFSTGQPVDHGAPDGDFDDDAFMKRRFPNLFSKHSG